MGFLISCLISHQKDSFSKMRRHIKKTGMLRAMFQNTPLKMLLLRQYFDPQHFFVKLSPINPNEVSDGNNLGKGIIEGVNLV